MGYIYRDLKPENILFDVNGYIKVSDYGLSKKLNPEEKAFSITGTPSYLSKFKTMQVPRFCCAKAIPSQLTGGHLESSSMK
jgi:serine/threonine protein kinase